MQVNKKNMKTDKKPHFESEVNFQRSIANEPQHLSQSQYKSNSQQIVIKNIDSGSYQVFNIEEVDSLPDTKESLSAETRVSLWNNYWDQMAKNDVKLLKTVLNNDAKRLIKILTEEPLELNSFKYIDGWTLLHHAILSSSPDIVRILLQHKIDVNACSHQMKRTALHEAVLSNKINHVQLLIKFSADPNLQDFDGNTAAHSAADLSYFDVFVALMESQIRLNLKLKNNQQMTIIDCIRDKNMFYLLQEEYHTEIDQNQNQNHAFQHRRVIKLSNGTVMSRLSKADLIQKFLNLNKTHPFSEKGSILKKTITNEEAEVTKSVSSSDQSTNSKKKYNQLGKKPSHWIEKKGHLIASQSIYLMKESIMQQNDPNTNSESLSNYEFLRFVGAGGFADVFLARRKKSSKLFAVKRISKSKIIENSLKRYVYSQRNIMIKLHHPFIVEAEGMFQDEAHLYISMEYCECGDLLRLLQLKGNLQQTEAKLYAAQVGLALQYMHTKNILFRDLKSANVLIGRNGYVKVSDFGLAKQSMVSFSFLGSVQYLAPEMLVDTQMKEHTKSIDWYLFGVLIYELLTGKPPFYAESQQIVFKKIKEEKPTFPIHLSKQCKTLLSKLLEKDPSRRLGSKNDFEQIKSHEWFKDVDFNKLYKQQYQMNQIESTIKDSDLRKKFPIDNFQTNQRYQYFKEWNYIKKNQGV